MKIAACVILYHPDPIDLEKDILAFASQIDLLILWRNSPEDIPIPDNLPCQIRWMGDGINHYIAHPLNTILNYCSDQGYDYLLTMDQDSEFDNFEAFLNQIKQSQKEGATENTIIFAPNINHRYGTASPSVLKVESTITSGSLCNVQKAKAIGGFRESYEINWVDDEFCHRARLAGFEILAFPEYNLKQRFGRITTVHGIDCYNYPAKTYYFIFRNMLWMHRQYKTAPSIRCILYTSQMYIKGILAGETDKCRKLKALGRGITHGLFKDYLKNEA